MRIFPVPDYKFKSLLAVTPEFLRARGVTLLLLDVDNTISPYGSAGPSPEFLRWAEETKAAGVRLFIVSNNRRGRPGLFARAAGIPFVGGAKKPSRSGLFRAMEEAGAAAGETALAGDQIYTDVLAANRAGAVSILVEPIRLSNPLHALRYALELPFRLARRMFRQGDVHK